MLGRGKRARTFIITMSQIKALIIFRIAVVFSTAMFFLSCDYTYQRVGEEAQRQVYPQGVAEDFVLTYTESAKELSTEDGDTTRVVAILTSPRSEDYENLEFGYRIFPNGLEVTFFDEENKKSIMKADYGIIYSVTNLIDLRGNVVIETEDGKKLQAPQLYWDRNEDWIFTEETFKFTNPEDGTIMDGEGMDFNRDFSFFNAKRTYGLMTIKEDQT